MLELKNIGMSYEQGREMIPVLRNINLEIDTGECLAVVGSSGCGKTTLLNIMAGLKRPTKGTVLYEQKPVNKPIQDMAMVFQGYGLFPWKTVRENMLLPLVLRHEKKRYKEADYMLEQLQLSEQADKYPCQLSGGQRQRVAIGRALLGEKKVVLMDEPFSALDPVIRSRLQKNVRELFRQKGITSVIVTHSVEEAVLMGDKIAVFAGGGREIPEVMTNCFQCRREQEEFARMQTQIKKLLTEKTHAA